MPADHDPCSSNDPELFSPAQIGQLIGATEADPDLGYIGRLMTLCCLPRTNPGTRIQYHRTNGPYRLTMTATGRHKLPYGNLPRLLLAWICTEAVRTQSRELVLGASLTEFMDKLGLYRTGGARGDITRLRDQMYRLFHAAIRMSYQDDEIEESVGTLIADRTEFWWSKRDPDEQSLFQSRIVLGKVFYDEIVRGPVPLDMNTLKALKRSSLGLDLYLWLTYRMFSLKEPVRLAWPVLYRQFGADPAKAADKYAVRDFRKDVLRELAKIKIAWPALRTATVHGGLLLSPSPPLIAAGASSKPLAGGE